VANPERGMNAIVLAGGGPDAVSATVPGLPNKAFVPIGGIALVERVVAALRAAPGVARIIAVAPAAMHGHPALAATDERRTDGARMIESLESGLAGAPPGDLILIAASDLPVLSVAAIAEFLEGAHARDLDVAYAIVSQRDHQAAYPHVPHTWAKMVEGRFCGGGLVALKPRVMPALRVVLDDLGAARKSPLRLAALLGWDILPRFALGSLTVEAAERRASAILRAPAGAIRCSHAEVAVNVDRPTDVGLANGLVEAAAKRAG
jgi:molybdopterin-guanine dinucleotide biosynthesis protein A